MKRENFITLIMGTIGGILFALGMCMCTVAEWGAFRQGVIVGAADLAVLLVMLAVRRKMQGKPVVKLNAKTAGIVALGVVGALILGLGMCMTMVWQDLFVIGIIAGIAGIVLLLSLIPLCKGLQKG